MKIEVYTDGSATVAGKPGGYGYVIAVDGEKHSEGSGHMESATNNDAELMAAIEGLTAARALCIEMGSDLKHVGLALSDIVVELVSDSQLVLGWASGRYKFKQAAKMDMYNQLVLLVNLLNVNTRWVRGHSGCEFNERCDKLANDARLQVTKQIEDENKDNTLIGTKKSGIVCIWYKNSLRVIDLEAGIVEIYNRTLHGARGSALEIREEKSR